MMMYDEYMATSIMDEDDRCGALVQLLKASMLKAAMLNMIHARINESPARSD
jgi:hypothetical protein